MNSNVNSTKTLKSGRRILKNRRRLRQMRRGGGKEEKSRIKTAKQKHN